MALTTKQITDLDNSMVAAQDVSLGTLLSAMQTNQVRSGSFIPVDAVTPIVTGLSSISGVTVSVAGNISASFTQVTATTGSVAGVIWVYCWKPTGSEVFQTPIAATTGSLVSWIASGSTV